MNKIWELIYNIFLVNLLYLAFYLAYPFNRKVRRGIRDRKRLLKNLENDVSKLDKRKKNIWFHSSSVGEFEQAKPIIEEIKRNYDVNIIVTFFSPSGYYSARKYHGADFVTYMPFDKVREVRRFINTVKPAMVVFMRYDLWPNVVWELKKKEIPVFLVDATMKEKSPRKLLFLKSFHRYLFGSLTKIIAITEKDRDGFSEFGIDKNLIDVAGDTRYDRVYQRSRSAKSSNVISEKIITGKKVFVAGSTWKEDEEHLIPCIIKLAQTRENILSVIVPHEPTIENLDEIEQQLKGECSFIRFSMLNNYSDEKVIVIDSVGILMNLYSYAWCAFVGGGFKYNVHNVLEPAVYGIPVIFGPKHSYSREAQYLIDCGGGFQVEDKSDIYKLLLKMLENEEFYKKAGENARKFTESNIGATEKYIGYLKTYL